eukprot:PhM_4_TR12923/c0_g1_i1/m.2482
MTLPISAYAVCLMCFILVLYITTVSAATTDTTVPNCTRLCDGSFYSGDRVSITRQFTSHKGAPLTLGQRATVLCSPSSTSPSASSVYIGVDARSDGDNPREIQCAGPCNLSSAVLGRNRNENARHNALLAGCSGYIKLFDVSSFEFVVGSPLSTIDVHVAHESTLPTIRIRILNGRGEPATAFPSGGIEFSLTPVATAATGGGGGVTLSSATSFTATSNSLLEIAGVQVKGCPVGPFKVNVSASVPSSTNSVLHEISDAYRLTGNIHIVPRPRHSLRRCGATSSPSSLVHTVPVNKHLTPALCVEVLNSCGRRDTGANETISLNFSHVPRNTIVSNLLLASSPEDGNNRAFSAVIRSGVARFGNITALVEDPFLASTGITFAATASFGRSVPLGSITTTASFCPVVTSSSDVNGVRAASCHATSRDMCLFERHCCWHPVLSLCYRSPTEMCSDVAGGVPNPDTFVCRTGPQTAADCAKYRTAGGFCDITCGVCSPMCVSSGLFADTTKLIPFPSSWATTVRQYVLNHTASTTVTVTAGVGLATLLHCYRVCESMPRTCFGVTFEATEKVCLLFAYRPRVTASTETFAGRPGTWSSASKRCVNTATASMSSSMEASPSETMSRSLSTSESPTMIDVTATRTASATIDVTATRSNVSTPTRTYSTTRSHSNFAPGFVFVSPKTRQVDIDAFRDPLAVPRPQFSVDIFGDLFVYTPQCFNFIRNTLSSDNCPTGARQHRLSMLDVNTSFTNTSSSRMTLTFFGVDGYGNGCDRENVTIYIDASCVQADEAPRRNGPLAVAAVSIVNTGVRDMIETIFAVASVANVVGPLTSFTGLMHVQIMQMTLESPCTLPALRLAARSSRFILRPLDTLTLSLEKDSKAMLGLWFVFSLIVTVAVAQVLLAKLRQSTTRGMTWAAACAATRFPNVTLMVSIACTGPLTACAIAAARSNNWDSQDVAIAAVIYTLVGVPMLVTTIYGVVMGGGKKEMRYVVWKVYQGSIFWNHGKWMTTPAVRRWHVLLNETRPGSRRQYVPLQIFYITFVAVAASVRPRTLSGCKDQFAYLLALHILFLVLVTVLRPMRTPWLRYLNLLVCFFNIPLCVLHIKRARDLDDIEVDVAEGAAAISGIALTIVFLLLVFGVSAIVLSVQSYYNLVCCRDVVTLDNGKEVNGEDAEMKRKLAEPEEEVEEVEEIEEVEEYEEEEEEEPGPGLEAPWVHGPNDDYYHRPQQQPIKPDERAQRVPTMWLPHEDEVYVPPQAPLSSNANNNNNNNNNNN